MAARAWVVGVVATGMIFASACGQPRRRPVPPPLPPQVLTPMPPVRTVESVVAEMGAEARARLAPRFQSAGLAYPPIELALLAFKRERRLEVWGRTAGPWVQIEAIPILAASGVAGPKLRRGDRQVPEGLYRVVALNPNSLFHLSMMLDYPNQYDLAVADREGRTDLGGDIFIHGSDVSGGCIAIGDRAIETLFVLVADVGLERVQVVVAPHDPRDGVSLVPEPTVWFTEELYPILDRHLRTFRPPAGHS